MIFFHFLVYLQFGNYWMNFQQKKVSAKNSRIVMERGESFLLEYFFFVFSFYAVYYTRAASLTFYQFLQRKKVHMIWHTYTWVHTFCYSYSSLGMNPLKCPLKMYFKFKYSNDITVHLVLDSGYTFTFWFSYLDIVA